MRATLPLAVVASVLGTASLGALLVRGSADGANAPIVMSSEPVATTAVDAAQRQLMGIQVSPVNLEAGNHLVRAFARVMADERQVYAMLSGTDGIIREASTVTTGSLVRKGQVLATFASADVVAPIQSYLNSINARQRIRNSTADSDDAIPVSTGNVSAQQTLVTLQQTADRLRALGVSDEQIGEIERTRQLPDGIRIVAPADGIVVAWQATAGLRFGKGHEWYRIADLRSVWIVADLSGPEATALRPGMEARVIVSGRPLPLAARVSGALPQFDAATQRHTVRMEIDNPGLRLRPDMLVDVEVPIPYTAAMSVPAGAVVDRGLTKRVFVEREDGSFEAREVQTGWRSGGRVEIVAGLNPRDRVVTAGAFFVESEGRVRGMAPPEAQHDAHAHH